MLILERTNYILMGLIKKSKLLQFNIKCPQIIQHSRKVVAITTYLANLATI